MPPAQPSNPEDHATTMLWMVGAILVISVVVWYVFKVYLVTAYLTIKLYEVRWANVILSGRFNDLYQNILFSLAHPEQVDPQGMLMLGGMIGSVLRIPFCILLAILAIIVYFSNVVNGLKRAHSIYTLPVLEKQNWPQIIPAIQHNLLKQDIDKGSWAMAMTPMQFCKKYRLLEEIESPRPSHVPRKEWRKVEVVLRRGLANQLFVLQLGPLWQGVDKLPLHTKALFAIFAARINEDSHGVAHLLKQLSISSVSKLNYQGVDALCKKHVGSKAVQDIIQAHAYVYTVMASMLEKARENGVQAAADFLWLKPMDRSLWYVLNTVGRQTPFVEVAGAFAHWIAEKEAAIKLLVPMIDEATNGLEIALKEIVYKPDER